jgi:hypothetical protein
LQPRRLKLLDCRANGCEQVTRRAKAAVEAARRTPWDRTKGTVEPHEGRRGTVRALPTNGERRTVSTDRSDVEADGTDDAASSVGVGGEAGSETVTDGANTTASSDGDAGDDTQGYVHRPGEADGSIDSDDNADADVDGSAGDGPSGVGDDPDPQEHNHDGFGRQGWVLVAAVVGCFLVIPGIIYLNPTAPARAGLPFFATFLVLPLVPALGLGLLAVWSMQAAS